MVRKVIDAFWDRNNLLGINDNFIELYKGEERTNILRTETEKLLSEAQLLNQKSEDALSQNKDVQTQIDGLVIESGNANAEVSQARGGFDLLNTRLADADNKIDNTERVLNVKALGAKGDGVTDDYQVIQDAITQAENANMTVYLPSGTYYVSKTLKTKQMTSYNYRTGMRLAGNGKDTIITRNHGKQPADYSTKEGLTTQAALSIYGANNIVENISFNDCKIGIYLGQDPSTTTQLSASMNRFTNVWMEYVGTGIQFTHGSGNHYNIFQNFHMLHAQICVDLGEGFFIKQFNNNRNVFQNFRVSRTWIGFLLRETDGNFFNNIFGETLTGDGAIGPQPSFLPTELGGKKTFIVALDGQYNVFNNYAAEAVEWYIYSVGFRNSFINGMTKDDSVAANKVMFPNPSRQPLSYLANSAMIAGFTYQPQAGIFFEGSNGIGVRTPYRLFDIGYHRQNVNLAALSSNITSVTSLSKSKANRLARKVEWSAYIRFVAAFAGKTDQYVKDPLKIKLPFTETPEKLYTNGLTTTYTKPFMVFVGNSNGATEVAQARICTADEAKEYGGYHLVINPPTAGWRTDANVNYLSFDISWNV
ncbi:glycosyl hydrolase family 28-related protein (plasmid) [Staphylococcus delphini]|uniref:glycosyl hydrolase family 28-related protein n=1 Tax=Staphylococcus delphini TaxID=53344 RepID=UPI003364BA1D